MMHSLGRYSYGTPHIRYNFSNASLRIGNFCSVADGVSVFLGGNHRVDWVTTYPFGHIHTTEFPFHGIGHPSSHGDVIVGHDVWIGADANLMSGITIGDGAVIAAKSHVVKDVAPYTVVGGNPARVIRKRFTDAQIEALLEIQWWHWDDAKILENVKLLCSPDVQEFIDAHTRARLNDE